MTSQLYAKSDSRKCNKQNVMTMFWTISCTCYTYYSGVSSTQKCGLFGANINMGEQILEMRETKLCTVLSSTCGGRKATAGQLHFCTVSFTPFHLVRHFHVVQFQQVRHFQARHSHIIWCVVFWSCIFMSCHLVCQSFSGQSFSASPCTRRHQHAEMY